MSLISFEFFYKKAKYKAVEALNFVFDAKLNKNKLRKKAVEYLYRNFNQTDKHIFYDVAVLDKIKMLALNTEIRTVKLSIENLAKNIINHPEISFEEYIMISEIVNKTELLIYIPDFNDENEKIICFTEKGKYYKTVIKSTKDKNENFLLSFHIYRIKNEFGILKNNFKAVCVSRERFLRKSGFAGFLKNKLVLV